MQDYYYSKIEIPDIEGIQTNIVDIVNTQHELAMTSLVNTFAGIKEPKLPRLKRYWQAVKSVSYRLWHMLDYLKGYYDVY